MAKSKVDLKDIEYNYEDKEWQSEKDSRPFIDGKFRRRCEKCGRPSIDINGVEDCDFCLQSLTVCDLVNYACCGHGDDDIAYISFKDGRRWILDTEFSKG